MKRSLQAWSGACHAWLPWQHDFLFTVILLKAPALMPTTSEQPTVIAPVQSDCRVGSHTSHLWHFQKSFQTEFQTATLDWPQEDPEHMQAAHNQSPCSCKAPGILCATAWGWRVLRWWIIITHTANTCIPMRYYSNPPAFQRALSSQAPGQASIQPPPGPVESGQARNSAELMILACSGSSTIRALALLKDLPMISNSCGFLSR
jgi:hypothetical protein